MSCNDERISFSKAILKTAEWYRSHCLLGKETEAVVLTLDPSIYQKAKSDIRVVKLSDFLEKGLEESEKVKKDLFQVFRSLELIYNEKREKRLTSSMNPSLRINAIFEEVFLFPFLF